MKSGFLRVCTFVGGVCLLTVGAGCGGSTTHEMKPVVRTTAAQDAARLMAGGSGHASIGGVRIDWQHEHDGHVCYTAKLPGHSSNWNSSVGSCIPHLRADQITYAISPVQKMQLVIVGVKGPRVKRVYLRFRDKRWTPSASSVVFFGYVPRGKVLNVVKVLPDGTRREFVVNRYSG